MLYVKFDNIRVSPKHSKFKHFPYFRRNIKIVPLIDNSLHLHKTKIVQDLHQNIKMFFSVPRLCLWPPKYISKLSSERFWCVRRKRLFAVVEMFLGSGRKCLPTLFCSTLDVNKAVFYVYLTLRKCHIKWHIVKIEGIRSKWFSMWTNYRENCPSLWKESVNF